MRTDRSGTVPNEAITAARVFSVERGEFWQARCARCPWTSGDLPLDSRGFAFHVGNLHSVLCEGRGRE